MRLILTMTFGALLAGCGADGEPVQPTRNATITLSDYGIGAVGHVGLRKGPFSVNLGVGL